MEETRYVQLAAGKDHVVHPNNDHVTLCGRLAPDGYRGERRREPAAPVCLGCLRKMPQQGDPNPEPVPHPFLELGPEMDEEVGCVHCLRVGTRTGWERQGWSCPHDECDGGPGDVYDPEKVLLMREPTPQRTVRKGRR